jgi:hypothetical protein
MSAIRESSKALSGNFESLWIAINSDQSQLRETVKKSFTMSTHAKSHIDTDRAGNIKGGSKEIKRTLQENRLVRILHLFPLFLSLMPTDYCVLLSVLLAITSGRCPGAAPGKWRRYAGNGHP